MTNSLLIYEESGYLFNDATKRLEWFEIDKILISFTYGVVRYIGTWGGGRTDKRLEGELFYIRKMNKIIEDYKKIVAGNEAGKNICFISRGEYADPKIAYNGILMNYWDVYDCMDEVEEPTDDDWLNAVSNLFDSYTYDVKNTDVDKFKMSDVMNVYRIINL